MISQDNLKNLLEPKELLGDRLFADLQDLMLNVQRQNGTGCRQGEHVGLIFNRKGGVCVKVDQNLTRVISE